MSARYYLSYTYFFKWTILNKKYYGSRVANKVEPRKDLWVNYFGSSDYVDRLVDLFGKPDIIRVDKTFTSEQETRDYEYQFLQENNCCLDPSWLNENDRPAPPIMVGDKNPMYGLKGEDNPNYRIPKTKEHKSRISKSRKGIVFSKKHRENLSKSTGKLFGKNHPNYGKPSHKRKKVEIKNICFTSLKEAAEYHEVVEGTIRYWIKIGKAKLST